MRISLLLIALLWPALASATQDVLLLPTEVSKKFSTKNGPLLVRFDAQVSHAGIEVRFRFDYAGATWVPDAELDFEVKFESDQATRIFADLTGERFWMRVPVSVRGQAAWLVIEVLGREIVECHVEAESGGLMKPELRGQMKKKPNQAPEPTAMLVTPRADARVAPSTAVAHL